jgi:hypothetical protein
MCYEKIQSSTLICSYIVHVSRKVRKGFFKLRTQRDFNAKKYRGAPHLRIGCLGICKSSGSGAKSLQNLMQFVNKGAAHLSMSSHISKQLKIV